MCFACFNYVLRLSNKKYPHLLHTEALALGPLTSQAPGLSPVGPFSNPSMIYAHLTNFFEGHIEVVFTQTFALVNQCKVVLVSQWDVPLKGWI